MELSERFGKFERFALRVNVVDVRGRCRGDSEEDLGGSFGHFSDPLAFKVLGFGFWVSNFEFRVSGFGYGAPNLGT